MMKCFTWFVAATVVLATLGISLAASADLESAKALFDSGRYAEALSKYRALADSGDLEAQFKLGVMYERGLGVHKDVAQAIRWYEKAASKRHTPALRSLASIYFAGSGVPKDQKKAFQLLSQAARGGDLEAKTFLAYTYENGYGTQRDLPSAIKLLREAAYAGHAPAQNALGIMYWRGAGVPQSDVEAYAWWSLASEQGDKLADENKKRLEAHLKPRAISQGEELAKKYRDQFAQEKALRHKPR